MLAGRLRTMRTRDLKVRQLRAIGLSTIEHVRAAGIPAATYGVEITGVADTMLAAYRNQQWQEARDLMEACEALDPSLTKLYDLYRDRIGQYERTPPGSNWDGVFVALTK